MSATCFVGALAATESHDQIVGAGIVGWLVPSNSKGGGPQGAGARSRPEKGGTTSAGMGHLVVMDDCEAQPGHLLFALSWQELANDLPRRWNMTAAARLGGGVTSKSWSR
jgi:hypothetical protein